VKLDSDGHADKVALVESNLGDEELEKCMASTLRSLSQDDLPLRLTANRERDPMAPGSRTLVGHPEVLAACVPAIKPDILANWER
jgi:hypothetical protein